MLDDRIEAAAEERIRMIVGILHQAFTVHRMPERRLGLALLKVAVARGLPTPPNLAAQAIIKIWTKSDGSEDSPLNESEVFVPTRSVIEVRRQATLQSHPCSARINPTTPCCVFGFIAGARQR